MKFPPLIDIIFEFCYQVKLSEKLSHVQSLCIHEMIVRAFKHILRAVIAAVDTDKMAVSVAATLNLLLGVPESGESPMSCNVHSLVWRWLELFLMKRYEWDISSFNYRDLRKFAILRGMCHKVLRTSFQFQNSIHGVPFCSAMYNLTLRNNVKR